MWFGTRGYETWVPMPAIDADFSRKGWASTSAFLNGGARVKKSAASHAEYNMAWNLGTRDALRPITDFSAGVFGDGLIYFIDPMAADKNVLPQHMAFPGQAEKGAPVLLKGAKPTFSNTPANTLRYPSRSATYAAGTTTTSLYLPIPPGSVAWVGAHGSATGTAKVRVTPVSGALTTLTLLPVTSTTRVNASFTGTGIVIDFTVPAASTLTLSGLIAQILPAGAVPAAGGFISGQGHSGCSFAEEPVVTAYSAVLEAAQVGMTAKLVEVGAWL